MAYKGLYGVYYALAHVTDGIVDGYTGGIKTMGKAISASFEPNTTDDNPLYANDAVAENDASGASGGTLTMTLDTLSMEAAADMYGLEVADASVNVGQSPGTAVQGKGLKYTGTEQSAPVGVAYMRTQQVNGVTSYEVLLYRRVIFGMPAREAQTKGESIEWQTPEIEGTVSGREGDGTNAWFEQMTFPTLAAATQYVTDYFAKTPPDDEDGGGG